jgi:hypothetical protein
MKTCRASWFRLPVYGDRLSAQTLTNERRAISETLYQIIAQVLSGLTSLDAGWHEFHLALRGMIFVVLLAKKEPQAWGRRPGAGGLRGSGPGELY